MYESFFLQINFCIFNYFFVIPAHAFKTVLHHNNLRALQYQASSFCVAKKYFAEVTRFKLRSAFAIIKDLAILSYLLLVRAKCVSNGRFVHNDKLNHLRMGHCENPICFNCEFSGIFAAVNLAVQGKSTLPLTLLSIVYSLLCKSSLSIVHVHSDITQVGSFLVCFANAFGVTTITGPHGCGAPFLEILTEQDGQFANFLSTLFASPEDHLPIIREKHQVASKILYSAPPVDLKIKKQSSDTLYIIGNGWSSWSTRLYKEQLDLYIAISKIVGKQIHRIYYRPHPVENSRVNLQYLCELFSDSLIEIDTLSLRDHELHDASQVYFGCNSTFLFQMRLSGHKTADLRSDKLLYTFSYVSDLVFDSQMPAELISTELLKLFS